MHARFRQLSYTAARIANRVQALSTRRGARAATILTPVVAFVVAVAAGAVSESSTDPEQLERHFALPGSMNAPAGAVTAALGGASIASGANRAGAPGAPAPPEAEPDFVILDEDDDPMPKSARAGADWVHESFAYVAPRSGAPRWIRHDVMPGERLERIAERYGVDRKEIAKWNRLSRKRPRLRAGQKLKVKARRFPAPRQHAVYRVRAGDTWSGLAKSFGLTTNELRRANRRRKLIVGKRLHVWTDSAIPSWGRPVDTPPNLRFDVPEGGVSVGLPYRGRLVGGVQLPESDLYTRRIPRHAYGTSRTIYLLQHSIASFRYNTGFEGELLIGGISRERGGKFKPHRSHRTGRDVDINLPAFPGFPNGTRARGGQVDWGATWALMRAMLDTGQVRYIFLSYRLQKRLYQAAKLMGASDDELEEVIQWPRGPRSRHGIVRYSKGHVGHFHVRFACGPNEPRCVDP